MGVAWIRFVFFYTEPTFTSVWQQPFPSFFKVNVAFCILCTFVQACEQFNILSQKLREKPTSIEELTEKRDWMKQIPEQIKSYKVHSEDINLLFL